MFYLSKLLPLFVLPLGLTLSALLVGLVLRVRWLTWMAVVVLWISSSPAVGQRVMRAAEAWAERVPVTDVSHADAIVVLSSGRSIAPGAGRVSEWGDADRFFGGVELFGAGKAPLLVFTGAGQGPPDLKARYLRSMPIRWGFRQIASWSQAWYETQRMKHRWLRRRSGTVTRQRYDFFW